MFSRFFIDSLWSFGVFYICAFQLGYFHSYVQVDQFIHRILVEEDANNSLEGADKMFRAAGEAGEKLYKKGDFIKWKNSDIDIYLLRQVPKQCLLQFNQLVK